MRLFAARPPGAVPALPLAFSVFCSLLCCGCAGSSEFSSWEIDGDDWEAAMRYEPRRKAIESIDTSRLKTITLSYLGTRYRYGGISAKGVDCSGLVCLVFRSLSGAVLPHSSKEMASLGVKIPLSRARPGDLLFFRRPYRGRSGHVAIYMGDNRFVHASSKYGVIESDINDEYYRDHFIQARRLFQ